MKTMFQTRIHDSAGPARDVAVVKTALLGCAFVLCTAMSGQAATFSGNAQGAWTSVDANIGFVISNTPAPATVTWGVEWDANVAQTKEAIAAYVAATTPNSNQMSFLGNSAWTTTHGGIFSLGVLEYRNGTSYAVSHDFMGANLTIDVALTDPLISGPLSFEYAFNVVTTTNDWISVPADADTLYVKQAPMSQYFHAGNQRYLFEILGLSSDEGRTFSNEFLAYEAWQGGYHHEIDPTRAEVYGRITLAPVPLPAGLSLLLSGLAAVGFVARRKTKKA